MATENVFCPMTFCKILKGLLKMCVEIFDFDFDFVFFPVQTYKLSAYVLKY